MRLMIAMWVGVMMLGGIDVVQGAPVTKPAARKSTSRPVAKTPPVAKVSMPERVKRCRFSRVIHAGVVRLTCVGVGSHFQSALLSAKFGALLYAGQLFTQRHTGQVSRAASQQFLREYAKYVSRCQTDGTMRQDDKGKFLVTAHCEIKRNKLEQFLAKSGAFRLPVKPTLVQVVLGSYSKNVAWNEFLFQTAEAYLKGRHFRVARIAKGQTPDPKKGVILQIKIHQIQMGRSVKGWAQVTYQKGKKVIHKQAYSRSFPRSLPRISHKMCRAAIYNAMELVFVETIFPGIKSF